MPLLSWLVAAGGAAGRNALRALQPPSVCSRRDTGLRPGSDAGGERALRSTVCSVHKTQRVQSRSVSARCANAHRRTPDQPHRRAATLESRDRDRRGDQRYQRRARSSFRRTPDRHPASPRSSSRRYSADAYAQVAAATFVTMRGSPQALRIGRMKPQSSLARRRRSDASCSIDKNLNRRLSCERS